MNGKDFSKYEMDRLKKNSDAVDRLIALGKQRQDAEMKLQQARHCKQRLGNKMEYLRKKKFNNQNAHNHRLIHKGIAIEYVFKNIEINVKINFKI